MILLLFLRENKRRGPWDLSVTSSGLIFFSLDVIDGIQGVDGPASHESGFRDI